MAGDSAATANVWLVLVDAAALAITAGGRSGVRMLLLLLTDMPSERTSGESAGFNVQHPGRRLHRRELQLGRRLLGTAVATAFLLLLLSASDSNLKGVVRNACLAGACSGTVRMRC